MATGRQCEYWQQDADRLGCPEPHGSILAAIALAVWILNQTPSAGWPPTAAHHAR
jgi:hypothetical protein